MAAKSKVMEFLDLSQKDPKLSRQVSKAVERGGMTTAEDVMRIAEAAGFSFTRDEFESEVRRNIEARYRAGEKGLAAVVNAKEPLESSCAKGCLSYTTSWHPSEVTAER